MEDKSVMDKIKEAEEKANHLMINLFKLKLFRSKQLVQRQKSRRRSRKPRGRSLKKRLRTSLMTRLTQSKASKRQRPISNRYVEKSMQTL